jgi:hypothetical protein
MSRGSSVITCLITDWTTARSGFDPRQRQRIFPLAYLYSCFPTGRFPNIWPVITNLGTLWLSILCTCPAHCNLLNFITVDNSGSAYKVYISLLYCIWFSRFHYRRWVPVSFLVFSFHMNLLYYLFSLSWPMFRCHTLIPDVILFCIIVFW